MTALPSIALRDAWREHPLDGARLWFHPESGTHVRRDGPETRHLRRVAPRVVLFGVTNRCNLTCSFCSRDLAAGSAWTVDGAFEVLRDLAAAGVLEVAFGGGEPLAFPGFDDLLARLAAETPLALHVTTNGTLLTPARLDHLRPVLGELRLSLYDDVPWAERVALLAASGLRFGANVLVTAPRVAALPDMLERLARLGCPEVALLRYVGPDPALHLDAAGERAVCALVAASPLPTKLSVCFGDRLEPVPRLPVGAPGDCGAGLDFVVITSDRRLKACSFHDEGGSVADAEDVLRAWRARGGQLSAPAGRPGCGRPGLPRAALADGTRVWRAFSGNNSGDSVLVGRFTAVEDARRFVEDLRAGFVPDAGLPGPWLDLLDREDVEIPEAQYAPRLLAAVGESVLALGYDAYDAFPSLRGLLWRRGGRAVLHGVHAHEAPRLAAGVAFPDAERLAAGAADLAHALPEAGLELHGLDLLGVVPTEPARALGALARVAAAHDAALAAELVVSDAPSQVPAPTEPDGPEWLWSWFPSAERAAEVAARLEGAAHRVDHYVILRADRIRARTGWLVHRFGGYATVVRGPLLGLSARLFCPWKRKPVPFDLARLRAELPAALDGQADRLLAREETPQPAISLRLATSRPADLVQRLRALAAACGAGLGLDGHDPEPVAAAVGRVRAELERTRARRPLPVILPEPR